MENTSEPSAPPSFAEMASQQKMHMLDLRPHFDYFELPEESVIGAAIRAIFPSDPAAVCVPMSGRMVGCYRVAATTEPIQPVIHLPRKLRKSTDIENISVPLLAPRVSGAERREGTLVTIVEADLGPAHAIPGREFDSAMSQYGVVVKNTIPQMNKKTMMLNGNRYVVVDTKNSSNPLPNRLIIGDQSFLLKYKGKHWYCSSCSTEHVGACPYLKRFYQLLDEKKSDVIETCILADSTLRLAEHVGLKADITCMPGATVGQLAQAVSIHPNQDRIKNYVIAAGANDTNIGLTSCPLTVAKKIDASLNKLRTTASELSTHNFTFFDTTEPKTESSPIQTFADRYFKARAKKVLKKDRFRIKCLHSYPEPWVEGHPTKLCTEDMLRCMAGDLILDDEFLSNERTYKGVQRAFVSACSSCDERGRYPQSGGFCEACIRMFDMKEECDDVRLFEKIKKSVFEEDFYMGADDERKRRRESNSSNDGHPEEKHVACDDA